MKTQVLAAFPGTGKTYYASKVEGPAFIMDLDTSDFTQGYDKLGNANNPDFPANYIQAVKDKIGTTKLLFVSNRPDVINMFIQEDINFILVYPDRSLKDEYLKRFQQRKSSQSFINLVIDNWDQYISFLEQHANCKHIVLKSNQYISDVV